MFDTTNFFINTLIIFIWKFISHKDILYSSDKEKSNKLFEQIVTETLLLSMSYIMLEIALGMLDAELNLPTYTSLAYVLITDLEAKLFIKYKKSEIQKFYSKKNLPPETNFSMVYILVFIAPLSIFFVSFWVLVFLRNLKIL